GKFEDPYYHSGNSGLIDIGNPEGMAGMVNKDINENLSLFGSFGGYWVENRGSDEVDSSLWGMQVGGTQRLDPDEDVYLTAGAAYYNYGNIQGQEALDDDFGGNSNSSGMYDNDYDLINVSAEIGFPLYDMPVRLFGDGVCNMRANTGGRSGYVVGFGINETQEPGDWYFFYNFQEVESDAVVDNFSGACFDGGTDGRGHAFSFGYKIAHNCVLDLAYSHGESSVDSERGTIKAIS
ncbi:MAG: hypothetical protein GY869_07215, partial [Planctomycetes bacterium]|nr:hypothetical protein [Planctomycetota bacterium]